MTSDVPACYMYLYSNTTKASLDRQLTDLETQMSLDDVNLGELVCSYFFTLFIEGPYFLQGQNKEKTLKALFHLYDTEGSHGGGPFS